MLKSNDQGSDTAVSSFIFSMLNLSLLRDSQNCIHYSPDEVSELHYGTPASKALPFSLQSLGLDPASQFCKFISGSSDFVMLSLHSILQVFM